MCRFIRAGVLAVLTLLSTCATAEAAPSAVIERVELMSRAALSTAAWSKSTDTYDRRYVYPTSWRVRLSGCGSKEDANAAVSPVPRLSWRLEPLEGQPGAVPVTAVGATGQCRLTTTVPALGRWRVTLTTADAQGVTATASKQRAFRDIVVAAVGDSFASGEGNRVDGPDDDPGWVDPQCHRSYNAWPAFTARALESDTTTVTYLSFACSGSDVSQLVNKSYGGIKSGARLPPQITALRNAIGDPTLPECQASVSASVPPCARPIFALLGATGINTIDVAGSLIDCMIDSIDELIALIPGLASLKLADVLGVLDLPSCQKDFGGQVSRLPRLLDGLELAISANLRVAQVHMLGYPARIMTGVFDEYPKKITGFKCSLSSTCRTKAALCGVFANTKVSDKQWMTKTVEAVNGQMRDASKRNGWAFTPTLDLFRGHGYCTPDAVITWIRSLNGSLRLQHDVNGTIHPNRRGQVAASEAVRRRVDRDAVAPRPDRFVITIKKLEVTLDDRDGPIRERPRQHGALKLNVFGATHAGCRPGAAATARARTAATCTSFVVTTAGRRINVRAAVGIQRFVPRKPPIPGEPGAGHGESVTLDVQRTHLRADDWDATTLLPGPLTPAVPVRRLVAKANHFGTLELEYTITRPFSNSP